MAVFSECLYEITFARKLPAMNDRIMVCSEKRRYIHDMFYTRIVRMNKNQTYRGLRDLIMTYSRELDAKDDLVCVDASLGGFH